MYFQRRCGMKKICLFLLFLLITSCSTIDTLEEIGVDNKRCIGIRRFKVLQAVYHNTGLAFECFTPDCSDAYRNNLDFILGDKVSEDLYDGMIYEVPTDKCAVRDGVFKYETKDGLQKTVSKIVFEYKNDYQSEEEHQKRIYKAKEDIASICINRYEDENLPKDEKYCTCYANSYVNNSGDAQSIKKECGKLPDFLPHN